MKNLAVLLVTLLAANVAIASGAGNLKVNLLTEDADMTVMEISNSTMSDFEIEVTNAYGEQLYNLETTTPVNQFKKRYNFSKLDDGNYFYSVKIDNEKVVKELEIENGKVEVIEVRKSVDPYFVQEENLLKFSFLNFQLEEIKIYVYDQNLNLLSESKLGKDFQITKAVDISDLKYGDYEVVITNSKDTYSHTFAVR